MTKNMTEGNPFRLIIGFVIPMLLGIVFQQLYNMVDTIIVGQFLGVDQLAGVGATGALNFLVLGFCIGSSSGLAVPVAQMFGAKRESELRRYVANIIWIGSFFALVLTTLVVLLCRPILRLLNTPVNIFEYAYLYIVIIFAGIPCTYLYNVLASILRSLGDSKTPVVFLAISSVLNLVLDIGFILVFGMGVEGPALATVISQGISGIICLFYIKGKYKILRISKTEWRPSAFHIKKLCYISIPMGLQYSITAIGTLVVQFAINGFGSAAVAGVTAAQKVQQLLTGLFEALGVTVASYTGQNTGAGKMDRVSQGVKAACICGFAVAAAGLFIAVFFGKSLIGLFLDRPDTEVIRYAYQFLVAAASGYSLLVLVIVVRYSIQGMGYSILAICAGVLEMGARGLAGTVGVLFFGYTSICLSEILAWTAADLFLIPAFIYCKKKTERMLVHKTSET